MTDTPTPAVPGAMAMTEERDATLRAHLERHGMLPEEYAEELFADRDRLVEAFGDLSDWSKGQDAQIFCLTNECETLRAQVREGEKVRAEAFSEGLEAAAAYVDRIGSYGSDGMAANIRALTPQPAPTGSGEMYETILCALESAPTEGGKG